MKHVLRYYPPPFFLFLIVILLSSCDTGITEPDTQNSSVEDVENEIPLDALGKTGSSDRECRRKKKLTSAIQCMRDLHAKGREERKLWTRALRAVRCNPNAMTASEAWDNRNNNRNKALWGRITRAIESCDTPSDIQLDVGFSDLFDPSNNGEAVLGKTSNDGDVRFIDGQTFSASEGVSFDNAMSVEIIIEVAASTNVTNFRVGLDGVTDFNSLGVYIKPADGQRNVPSGDTYPSCKASNNCFEIVATELGVTESLLRDTPPPSPVNRGRRTFNFYGDTIDDNIVGPDARHKAIIRIRSVNGSGSIPSGGALTFIVEEDDISWVDVWHEPISGGSRILARESRQVLDEINLRGDLEGPGWRGTGNLFWLLPLPSSPLNDIHHVDLTLYADCSMGRAVIKPLASPRLSGANTVGREHVKIRWDKEEIVVCN